MSTEQFSNNAATTLGSAIGSGDTSITVATGTGDEFPTLSGGQYFTATLVPASSTTGEPNEIVKVTGRTGDTMTVVRGQEGTAARAWSIGDSFSNYPTAAFFNALAAVSDVQLQAGNSANDTGTANAGTITLAPAVTILSQLLLAPIRVLKVSSANTGPYTINVNGLGAVAVEYNGLPLAPGMLPASQVFQVIYDGTVFELVNPNLTGVFAYNDNMAAGSYSLTVPAWATHAAVEIIGGGGGGAGAGSGFAGGGGGAGGYAFGTVSVTPGATLTAVVGAAGTAGSSGGGTAGTGGTSSLTGVGNATGGGGGSGGLGTSAGGPGGTATASGIRALTGGYGGDGDSANTAIPGGNGAAGPYGGQGRTGAGTGLSGAAPGAGGGGCWNGAGTGGAGAPGAVLVTWLP